MPFNRDRQFDQPAGLRGYTFAAPLVVTVLPAGHQPGFYMINISVFLTTAGAGGNINGTQLAWNEQGFGAASLTFGNVSLTATGLIFDLNRKFQSSGLGPITYTITPASVSGSPVGNVACIATRLSNII